MNNLLVNQKMFLPLIFLSPKIQTYKLSLTCVVSSSLHIPKGRRKKAKLHELLSQRIWKAVGVGRWEEADPKDGRTVQKYY